MLRRIRRALVHSFTKDWKGIEMSPSVPGIIQSSEIDGRLKGNVESTMCHVGYVGHWYIVLYIVMLTRLKCIVVDFSSLFVMFLVVYKTRV